MMFAIYLVVRLYSELSCSCFCRVVLGVSSSAGTDSLSQLCLCPPQSSKCLDSIESFCPPDVHGFEFQDLMTSVTRCKIQCENLWQLLRMSVIEPSIGFVYVNPFNPAARNLRAPRARTLEHFEWFFTATKQFEQHGFQAPSRRLGT